MLHILWAIICGAIIGSIAGSIMKSEGSFWKNVVVGVVGSSLGHFIFTQLNITGSGFVWNLVVEIVGACIFLWLLNLLIKK